MPGPESRGDLLKGQDAPVGPREGTSSYPSVPSPPHDPYQAQDQQDGHAAPGGPNLGTQSIAYRRPTSGTAVASLVLAILTIIGVRVVYSYVVLELVAIGAVVCGHLGIRDTAGGRKRGRWMAMVGLILGYICAITLLGVISFILLLVVQPGGIGV